MDHYSRQRAREEKDQNLHDTLSHLTFRFIKAYASIIWPFNESRRSHLNSEADKQLRAVEAQIRASPHIIKQLSRDLCRPYTEQMILVESVTGRRVREFFKELVKMRPAPLHDSRDMEQLLLTVLRIGGSIAPGAPTHPKITSARYPCPHPGCNRTYAWSDALTAHLNQAHPIIDPSFLNTTMGLHALPPFSIIDKQTMHETLSHSEAVSAFYPCPHEGCSLVFTRREPMVFHHRLDHLVAMHPASSISLQDDTQHWKLLYSPGMVPTHWMDTQTGDMIPVSIEGWSVQQSGPQEEHSEAHTRRQASIAHPGPAGCAAAPLAGPNHEDNRGGFNTTYSADQVHPEDSEQDLSGLLCPHSGCPRRFPDWASFDAHAQQPHDDDVPALNSGNEHTANNIEGTSGLINAMSTSTLGGDGLEIMAPRQEVRSMGRSGPGDALRWRDQSGERT